MAKARRDRQRGKSTYANNPHEPISPQCLQACMDRRGFTVAMLAKASGDSEQNIASILKSDETRTTRRLRRASYAKALGVSIHMISGDAVFFPTGSRVGYETRYSARTQLALGALVEKCVLAARRDLKNTRVGEVFGTGELSILYSVQRAAKALLEIGKWRAQLLRFEPARHPAQGYLEPLSSKLGDMSARPVKDGDHEAAVVALARAFEHILGPWFDGSARLDYGALRTLGLEAVHPRSRKNERPQAILEDAWTEEVEVKP